MKILLIAVATNGIGATVNNQKIHELYFFVFQTYRLSFFSRGNVLIKHNCCKFGFSSICLGNLVRPSSKIKDKLGWKCSSQVEHSWLRSSVLKRKKSVVKKNLIFHNIQLLKVTSRPKYIQVYYLGFHLVYT